MNRVVGPQRRLRKAGVAKLADAPDLGSGSARSRGSSPLPGIFLVPQAAARLPSHPRELMEQRIELIEDRLHLRARRRIIWREAAADGVRGLGGRGRLRVWQGRRLSDSGTATFRSRRGRPLPSCCARRCGRSRGWVWTSIFRRARRRARVPYTRQALRRSARFRLCRKAR